MLDLFLVALNHATSSMAFGHVVQSRTFPTQDWALAYAKRLVARLVREAGSPAG